jgi:hypothetical protein
MDNPERSVNWKLTKRSTVPSTGSSVVLVMIKRVKYLCLVGSLQIIYTLYCVNSVENGIETASEKTEWDIM